MRVDCSQHSLEQIEKQMHKLVNVLRVSELEPGQAVERELALITVAAPPARRAELLSLAEVFGGRVVDVGPDGDRVRSGRHAGARSTRSRSSSARTGSRSSPAPAGSASPRASIGRSSPNGKPPST